MDHSFVTPDLRRAVVVIVRASVNALMASRTARSIVRPMRTYSKPNYCSPKMLSLLRLAPHRTTRKREKVISDGSSLPSVT